MPQVSCSRVPSFSQLHAHTCTLLPSLPGPLSTALLASLPLILTTLAACPAEGGPPPAGCFLLCCF